MLYIKARGTNGIIFLNVLEASNHEEITSKVRGKMSLNLETYT